MQGALGVALRQIIMVPPSTLSHAYLELICHRRVAWYDWDGQAALRLIGHPVSQWPFSKEAVHLHVSARTASQ